MANRDNRKKGMTLIELIIAMGLVAVIVAASFTVISTYSKTFTTGVTSSINMENLRSAMIQITKKVRNAGAGTVTITGTKVLTISSTNFSVSSGSLNYGSTVLAKNISSINADYTDSTHTGIQVDLTSSDGNTLSAQIRVN